MNVHDAIKPRMMSRFADVAEYEDGLYERMAAQHADVLEAIRTTGDLSKETEEALRQALESYTRDFLSARKAD